MCHKFNWIDSSIALASTTQDEAPLFLPSVQKRKLQKMTLLQNFYFLIKLCSQDQNCVLRSQASVLQGKARFGFF